MGVFYYIHSVALIEDLPLEEHYDTPQEFYAAADVAYSQVIIFNTSVCSKIDKSSNHKRPIVQYQ